VCHPFQTGNNAGVHLDEAIYNRANPGSLDLAWCLEAPTNGIVTPSKLHSIHL